jgi:hypothetical protein
VFLFFAPARVRAKPRLSVRPIVEMLEDRALLSTVLPQASTVVNFTIGRMVADPDRNLVYVADKTTARILAVDTGLGRSVGSGAAAGNPGALAVSIDDQRLFVAEPGAFQIQVLSLPSLTPMTTLPVGFEVDNLVAAANDHLFVSTPSKLYGYDIDEVDAATGTNLGTISKGPYFAPLLRTNPTGTHLYIHETGVSGPDTNIDEYDVGGPGPYSLNNGYLAPLSNSKDFIVNESARRIYTSDGGVYGVGVTNMDTNQDTVWSFGGAPYGDAVAALASGPIYGASYFDGVYQFDAGGTIEHNYPSVGYNYGMMDESLKITPNGHLLYAASLYQGNSSVYQLAILGTSTLVIDGKSGGGGNSGQSISGTVFDDSDGNGAMDGGEQGLSGRTIYLDSNNNGRLDPAEARTSTGTDGSYSLTGLKAGVTYRVREVMPAGWLATSPTVIAVRLGAGQSAAAKDFGAAMPGSISGNVYDDVNGDGSNDLPLKGRLVYLNATSNGRILPVAVVRMTAADGSYAFNGLKPGVTYEVRVAVPLGWVATTPTKIDVTASEGQNATGNNFGMALPATISGNVFDDVNADGQKERGERGLAQWTVFIDANGNGTRDLGEVHMLTDYYGNYRLRGLPPGTYTVRLTLKPGWNNVQPQDGSFTLTLTGGQVAGGENFAVNM